MLDCNTNGIVFGQYVHEDSYWNNPNKVTSLDETAARELWASFYAGTFFRHEEYYREYFPESVDFFEAMSENMKH